MPETEMIAYCPHHFHVGGTYRVQVGRFFYIGSTRKLGARNSDHRVKLERGEHHCFRLQSAYDETGSYEFVITKLLPEKPDEPAADYRKRRQMWEQIQLTEWFGSKYCVNASSDSGFNTTIGGWLKDKWADPEFREAQVSRLKERRGDAVSPETRKKMALAKLGRRNPKSRKCEFTFDGKTLRFSSASGAARHFEVSQQVIDLWLRGVVPWPGTGMRVRGSSLRLVGLTGRYLVK